MVLMHTPEAQIGTHCPDFRLPDLDGRLLSRDGLKGPNGLLVAFLCAHCPYVQAIEDRLAADLRELRAHGIGTVAICSNDPEQYPEDGREGLRAQAKRAGFDFPYLIDDTQAVARAFGAVCTPDFFGYDRDLRLAYRGRLDEAHRGPRKPGMRRELVEAMLQIAQTGKTTIAQIPSMGCSIKWKR
jgi:peroxiredoxin